MNSTSPPPLVDLTEQEQEASKARVDDDSQPETITMESSSNSTCEIEKPILRVSFRDFDASCLFRPKLISFLTELDTEGHNRISYDFENHILEVWDNVKAEDGSGRKGKQETTTTIDDTESSFFIIDTCPKVSDDLDIPTYKKKYDQILEKACGTTEDPVIEEKREVLAPKLNCFNCTGNHNLRDCTEPKNYANINRNRKDFLQKQGPKNVRYHVDEDQKFGHFVPGRLSDNLRNALGLRDGDLPRHIYRMRSLGYPPGWLEEARMQHSGISLFNSDGMKVVDQEVERGEIEEESDKDRYDMKKIYDFPGFNVPPPPGTHDDCYWALESQLYHSKETMLTMLSSKKADEGYKRKKLKTIHDSSDLINAGVGEMEIENLEESVVESLPVNGSEIEEIVLASSSPGVSKKTEHSEKIQDGSSSTATVSTMPSIATGGSETAGTTEEDSQDSQVQEDPRTPESESLNVSTASSPSRANSPSLSDLESRKKQLLAELDDTSSPSNPDTSQMPPPATNSTPIGTRTTIITTTPSSSTNNNSNNNNNNSNNDSNNSNDDSINNDSNNSSSNNNNNSNSNHSVNGDGVPGDPGATTARTPNSKQNNHHQGTVKSVDLGTPILQSTSPYRKLPSSEKFSKDICDVINFENLPDATGKYERMTGIIQKVRDTLTRIHQE